MHNPVLFLVFNRPSTTKKVFESIRQAKPPRLYIASDGPRENKPDDIELCQKVKEIVSNIDWDCKVTNLYRNQNLGCKKAVSSAITWFFECEEQGIILEDDVLPLPCFFYYCDELLNRYKDDHNISMISGNNLISKRFHSECSYFFSHYANIWGWATWRRVWNQYDVEIKEWEIWKRQGFLSEMSDKTPFFEYYWKDQIQAIYDGKTDTWDFQLFFLLWRIKGLCIVPQNNLTTNLGFGAFATHTTGQMPDCVKESIPEQLSFPLVHPLSIERQSNADMLISERVFNIGLFTTLKWKARRTPILGKALAKVKALLSQK
jgi:hypothetical protein